MPLTVSNESKNNLTITNEAKNSTATWADMVVSWEKAKGTWASPRRPLVKESKNSLSISNEAKS
ncbi:MAG: hypothetical protein UT82_C0018G0023 [Parcubacteria group bacterium GW2011_GWB1_40_14]|nr:MAG: hypothetical protein UT82_C0018G0023 [Parcubacteria group bacterium GW2011_GWB1_40_14]